jgi:hypothetical protein
VITLHVLVYLEYNLDFGSPQDYWNKLLDSNIRAGTMACMWCMKAQVVKRISVAFFRWKYGVSKSAGTGGNNSLFSSPTHKSSLSSPHGAPMSAVLAHAISVANHIKRQEVESELNFSPISGTESHIFRSPSASVQAANAAATSVLQHDLQIMPPPLFPWHERRRAGSFTSVGGGAASHEAASGEFKHHAHDEGNAAPGLYLSGYGDS